MTKQTWFDRSLHLMSIARHAGNAAAVTLAEDARAHFVEASALRRTNYVDAYSARAGSLLAQCEHRKGIKAFRQAERLLGLADESERLAA